MMACLLMVTMIRPLEVQGKSRIDIVFIIDRSGSMGNDINSVRDNIDTFVNRLTQENIDYRLGLISYERTPTVYAMTTNVNTFKSNLNSINVSGGIENGLDAIKAALDEYTYYANSVKYFVLIGDERVYSQEGHTDNSIIRALNDEGVILTTVGLRGENDVQFKNLANQTGGLYLDITRNFSASLMEIFDQIHRMPNVEILSPTTNQWLGGSNQNFVPSLKVSDPDSDLLTITYNIDGGQELDRRQISNSFQEQIVNLSAFNVAQLSDGNHTLEVTVSDTMDSVSDYVNFRVDNTEPIKNRFDITSVGTNNIAVTGRATDNGSGLAAQPYGFIIGSANSGWRTNTSYGVNNLTPNTSYNVTFQARDTVGNVFSETVSRYTLAQPPNIDVQSTGLTDMNVRLNDDNPSHTQYEIMVDNQYVQANGQLSNTPQRIALNNKSITIQGLEANTRYNVKARAYNEEQIATSQNTLNVYTKPQAPSELMGTPMQESIHLQWQGIEGVQGYVLELNQNKIQLGNVTSYTHTGLSPETTHSYRIAAYNQGGEGAFSETVNITTLPYPPAQPNVPTYTLGKEEIALQWQAVPGATSYELEVNGEIISLTSTNYLHKGLTPESTHTYRLRAVNAGGASSFTPLLTLTTYPYPPETPELSLSDINKNMIQVQWEDVEKAEGYHLMVNGVIMSMGSGLSYTHNNLVPLSTHTYQVRAHNLGGQSLWSAPLEIQTYPEEPDYPKNIMGTASQDSITLTWYLVPYAEYYEIEIDNNTVKRVDDLTFVHKGLNAEEQHTYRVRAVNVSGKSDWSIPVQVSTLPKGNNNYALTNVAAIVTNNQITLSWDTVKDGASYEIEVDGQLQSLGEDTLYRHSGLEPNEFHTYKIRVITESGSSEWCAILSLSTLPNPPDAPEHIYADANLYQIELRWDVMDRATAYDVEIDGDEIITLTETQFRHQGLEPGTAHSYRIRAKNMTDVTAWSQAIVVATQTPDYLVQYEEGETFSFTILANNIQDFNQLYFVLEYDPNELEIVDLFEGTAKKDVNLNGLIEETSIIVNGQEGKILFMVDLNMIPGTSWSGEITSIVFEGLNTGESSIKLLTNE